MIDRTRLDCANCGHSADTHIHISPHPCRAEVVGDYEADKGHYVPSDTVLCACDGFVWRSEAEAYVGAAEAKLWPGEKFHRAPGASTVENLSGTDKTVYIYTSGPTTPLDPDEARAFIAEIEHALKPLIEPKREVAGGDCAEQPDAED